MTAHGHVNCSFISSGKNQVWVDTILNSGRLSVIAAADLFGGKLCFLATRGQAPQSCRNPLFYMQKSTREFLKNLPFLMLWPSWNKH